MANFVKKHDKSSTRPKLETLAQTIMVFHFGQLFGQKLQKVAHFVKKHEKSSVRPNLANFSHKLSWSFVLGNFLAESCKKWLIS